CGHGPPKPRAPAPPLDARSRRQRPEVGIAKSAVEERRRGPGAFVAELDSGGVMPVVALRIDHRIAGRKGDQVLLILGWRPARDLASAAARVGLHGVFDRLAAAGENAVILAEGQARATA